jgi:uncharacterized cupredoxin-like copper-binding protein
MRLATFILALAALPALAAARDDAPRRTVEVDLSSFSFAPETIRLRAGEPIKLHLVNTGGGGHNFAAPQFFAAAHVAPADAAKIAHGAIEVPGHESVDVALTAPAAGEYRLHCSHPLHAAFGMTGEIVVS